MARVASGPLPLPAALVLGAAAGLTCGYFAFGGRAEGGLSLEGAGPGSPPAAPGEPAPRTAGIAGASAPTPAAPSAAASLPAERSADPIVAPAGGFGSLAQALAAVPEGGAATQGEAGECSGTVTTEDGRPLEGVVLRAERLDESADPDPPLRGAPPPAVPDVESHVRKSVTDWRRQRAEAREAVSGADGRWKLTGLANDGYQVTPWKEGYVFQAQGGQPGAGGWQGQQDWYYAQQMQQQMQRGRARWNPRQRFVGQGSFRAEPGGTLDLLALGAQGVTVSVVLPDGTPPANARLTVQSGQGGWTEEKWTPKSPPLRLAPGEHKLTARVGNEKPREVDPDEPEYRSSEVPVTVESGAPVPPVVLKLKPRVAVKGRVSDPAGDWKLPAVVYAQKVTPETPADVAHVKQARQQAWASPGVPVFALRDLAPGRYALAAARRAGGDPGPIVTVDVGERTSRADLELPAPEPPTQVVVTALAPDGRVLGDVQITVQTAEQGGNVWISQRDRTPEGGHRLTLASWGQAEGAGKAMPRLVVTVTSSLYGAKTAEVGPGQTAVRVQFVEPASLEATVTGYRGSGLEGEVSVSVEVPKTEGEDENDPTVSARMTRRYGRGGAWLSPDAEGRCQFRALEPGPREVVLYVNSGHSQTAASRTPLVLHAGPNSIALALPTLYKLTVTVEGAGEQSYAMLRTAAEGQWGGGNWQMLDSGGRATFDKVAAGKYAIQVWGNGADRGTMTVTVPGASVLKFQPDVQDAMRVNVQDKEGALAKAGFQTGDLVVAVEGTGFKSQAEFAALLAAGVEKAEVTLTILRGGASREAKLPPRAIVEGMLGAGKLGGSLEAASRK